MRASWGADEHRGVAVEVLRGEVDAALVRQDQLLHTLVGDPEHEHVGEPLAGLWIERVGPAAAVDAEELPVHVIGRAPVVGHLLGHLRHGERELVQILHRGHGPPLVT